jgi:catechol 2,3-dioxygenase-like lactoylglutathione lyase family enzyme
VLTGLNHLTFAVTDVARSVDFYSRLLGCRLVASWDSGAYLRMGELWLCLSLDLARSEALNADYTHCAFTIGPSEFGQFCERMRAAGVGEWKENRSEGESFYFLDPDAHRLEAHVGNLESRIAQCRYKPYPGMQFFE